MLNKIKLKNNLKDAAIDIASNYVYDKYQMQCRTSDFSCMLITYLIEDQDGLLYALENYPELAFLIETVGEKLLIKIVEHAPYVLFYIKKDQITLGCIKAALKSDDLSALIDMDNKSYIDLLDQETALKLARYDIDLIDGCKGKEWYDTVIRLSKLEQL